MAAAARMGGKKHKRILKGTATPEAEVAATATAAAGAALTAGAVPTKKQRPKRRAPSHNKRKKHGNQRKQAGGAKKGVETTGTVDGFGQMCDPGDHYTIQDQTKAGSYEGPSQPTLGRMASA